MVFNSVWRVRSLPFSRCRLQYASHAIINHGDTPLCRVQQLLESTCISISNNTEGNKEKAGHLVG